MLYDNKGVVLNTTLSSSALKKKHKAIACHRVREAVAAKIAKVSHMEGKENIADIDYNLVQDIYTPHCSMDVVKSPTS